MVHVGAYTIPNIDPMGKDEILVYLTNNGQL